MDQGALLTPLRRNGSCQLKQPSLCDPQRQENDETQERAHIVAKERRSLVLRTYFIIGISDFTARGGFGLDTLAWFLPSCFYL